MVFCDAKANYFLRQPLSHAIVDLVEAGAEAAMILPAPLGGGQLGQRRDLERVWIFS